MGTRSKGGAGRWEAMDYGRLVWDDIGCEIWVKVWGNLVFAPVGSIWG